MKALRRAALMVRVFLDYRMRSERVRTMPIRAWIETSSVCNLRCIMCPNKSLSAADKGLMRFDLFRKVIDELKGSVRDVYLHHRGEPLLNPDLFRMIAYAEAAGVRTRFHTNGTLLTEEKASAVWRRMWRSIRNRAWRWGWVTASASLGRDRWPR